MASYSAAEARDVLPDLIDRALNGEEVVLTPDGEPMRKLQLVAKKLTTQEERDAYYDRLDRWQDEVPPTGIDSAVLIRRMRDEEDDA